jgi:predicted MPP superfamily phosphohydrolase
MSMICDIGDLHGEIDIQHINNKKILSICKDEYPEYVIVNGDFCFIWNGSEKEKYWIRRLNEKPFKILFCDGNHENHEMLNNLESVEMFDGIVGKVSDNIYHLKRGYVYNIDGKSIFTMGGATSIDKDTRKNRISWWEEEVPS